MNDMHTINVLHLVLDNSYHDDIYVKKKLVHIVNIFKVHGCLTLSKGKIIGKAYEG